MSKNRAKRIAVNPDQLDVPLDDEQIIEALGIPREIWDEMPDSKKLILIARQGQRALLSSLEDDAEEDS